MGSSYNRAWGRHPGDAPSSMSDGNVERSQMPVDRNRDAGDKPQIAIWTVDIASRTCDPLVDTAP
jgi:hypothetical protein